VAAATLANISFKMRMNSLLVTVSSASVDFDAKLQSAGGLGKGGVEVELSPRTAPGR
jgi:hypothetical protein